MYVFLFLFFLHSLERIWSNTSSNEGHQLALGNNIWKASQAYVIVAGEAFEQNTLLQAVDVCFKMFYIFNIHYPKE